MGIFGNLFNLNGDGQLDSMEKAIEFGAFMNMVESEDKETDDDDADEDF